MGVLLWNDRLNLHINKNSISINHMKIMWHATTINQLRKHEIQYVVFAYQSLYIFTYSHPLWNLYFILKNQKIDTLVCVKFVEKKLVLLAAPFILVSPFFLFLLVILESQDV